MDNRPVVVMDSGVGGLPYLARIRVLLASETLCYVADTAHFPYGDRTDGEVITAVVDTARDVARQLDPKLLVVACNTASVLALDRLRAVLRIPVVGVVPAVKPACEATTTGSIGVLATERTVAGRYLDDLVARHCDGCSVSRCAAGVLVRFVEEELGTPHAPSVTAIARPYIAQFVSDGVDTVVLGCTHFVYLAEELAAALGNGCTVVDSRDGVARQTARVAARLAPGSADGPARLYVTGDRVPPRYEELARQFEIEPVGSLCRRR